MVVDYFVSRARRTMNETYSRNLRGAVNDEQLTRVYNFQALPGRGRFPLNSTFLFFFPYLGEDFCRFHAYARRALSFARRAAALIRPRFAEK